MHAIHEDIAQPSLNAFRNESSIVQVPSTLLESLIADVAATREELALRASEIRGLQDENRELRAWQEEHVLENAYAYQRIAKLENAPQEPITKGSGGKKTNSRIKALKAILKAHNGSWTFAMLQEEMDLSPSQFSKLVDSLDMRSFEVFRRPGAKRGEKVLKLRVQPGQMGAVMAKSV